MQLNGINTRLSYSIPIVGLLLALTNSEIQAGTMGSVGCLTGCPIPDLPDHVYAGVFGGGGVSNNVDASQHGTSFNTGGFLAVDAFGSMNHRDAGLGGAQIGYQWNSIGLNAFHCPWSISPAVELEGYYLGKGKFHGNDLVNNSSTLTEHDFRVTLPMNTGAFFANAIINFNPALSRWHPYLGGGIGGAVLIVSDADSLQVSPLEPGVNHFNSNPSDTASAFAAQGKVGVKFDLSKCINLFVEYRGVYITDSEFNFGSTVVPGHATTSSWLVKLDSQYYNTGAVGIQFIV